MSSNKIVTMLTLLTLQGKGNGGIKCQFQRYVNSERSLLSNKYGFFVVKLIVSSAVRRKLCSRNWLSNGKNPRNKSPKRKNESSNLLHIERLLNIF